MARKDEIDELRASIQSIMQKGRNKGSDYLSEPGRPLRAQGEPEAVQSYDTDVKGSSCQEPDAESSKAFKKIAALVNASDKSEHAIRERLVKEGFSEAALEAAIARAKEVSFIDDMRFAEVLVRSRLSQGKGKAGIERELRQHDIDPDSVPGWPDDYFPDADDELMRALAFLEHKPPRSKNPKEGAFRKLMQKGYSASVASSASRIWFESLQG